MSKRNPYPLQWPADVARTVPRDRSHSQFGGGRRRDGIRTPRGQVSPYEAAKQLLAELDRMVGVSHVVITSQLPTRHDGLPYSDGRSDDPGIAVWFVLRGHETVLACDHWHTPGENMRAIALTIEAMRGLERWGVANASERAFAGFAALPAAGATSNGAEPAPVKRAWREVLGVSALVDSLLASDSDDLIAVVKARHRKLIAQHHPDRGGDPAVAVEINLALREAEEELS